MLLPVNPAGRPQGKDDAADPFVPDLSEGAETGVYLALLELLDEGLVITGDEVILDANGAACRLLGRDYRQVAGRPLAELFPSERAFLDARARLFIHGETRGSLSIALPDGGTRDFRFIAAARLRPGIHALILSPGALPASDGEPSAPYDAIWPRLAGALVQPLIVVDADGRINAANAAALRMLRVAREDAIGHLASACMHIVWPEPGAPPLAQVRVGSAQRDTPAHVLPGPRAGWRLLLLQDATPRGKGRASPAAAPAVPLSIASPSTASPGARADTSAMYLNSHDLLTGLPNRSLFEARFADAVARARQRRCSLAVMRIDLDGFKTVNRELGDRVGDTALRLAAQRLAAALGQDGVIARERSDNFMVLLPDVDHVGEAERCAEDLRRALEQPVAAAGNTISLTASIGIALFPQDAQSLDAMLGCARAALDHARRLGRNRIRLYHPEADRADVERHHFAAGLRHALERRQLELHFQPLVDARDGRIRAGEALLRWNHPRLGQIPYSRFIGAVRDGSLIARLGDWALQAACRLARNWPQSQGQPLVVTVNIAIEHVQQGDLLAGVSTALAASGLPPHCLELDLDEQVLEEESPVLAGMLKELAGRGVRLAIDDFGRGLCSIPRLKRHPLRALKLHPALVRGVGRQEQDEAIVEAIASMAAPLGLEVYARGVADEAQQAFLGALDCHLQQGPLFGRPMSAAAFQAFLLTRT